MDRETVLRARMKLLSTDRPVLHGPDALWVYRVLAQVSPAAYGSKLAVVLLRLSDAHRLRELPDARRALLEEALAVAKALDAADPYRDMVLSRALRALRWEETPVPAEKPGAPADRLH